MPIDFGPWFRRLLLTAGIPVMSLSCAEDGGKPAGRCVGGWGTNLTTGGCRSGPYTTKHDTYLELATANAEQLALYEQCVIGESCPESLCLDLIGYKPVDPSPTGPIVESFGSLVTCEPACKDDKHRGVHVVYTLSGSCTGRRPEGLSVLPALPSSTEAGAFFADVAQLEGASVVAFARLAMDLTAHGAPAVLVAAARRAMREEARHFKTMAALAARFGGSAQRPRVSTVGERALEDVALENVTEGCVVETFGAVVGAWQATASVEPTVRSAMANIAREEMAHACLSWEVDRWARSKLERPALERLNEAYETRVNKLARETAHASVSDELAAVAGLPRSSVQQTLFNEMRRQLWDHRPTA